MAYSVWRGALLTERHLKKQSQFAGGSIDIKSVLIMVYGDVAGARQKKNKPSFKRADRMQSGFPLPASAGMTGLTAQFA
jgi:hypothetical protein